MTASENAEAAPEHKIEASSGLASWLHAKNVALIVSAYQSGYVIVIGTAEDATLQFAVHRFDRAMGLARTGSGLWIATRNKLHHFVSLRGVAKANHDTILIPHVSHHTGFINAHDISLGADERPLVAAPFLNCVVALGDSANIIPHWSPSFIESLVFEDHCHLNGIETVNGQLRYVTTLSNRDRKSAWREDLSSGCLFDATQNKILADKLWQPHSPRFHMDRVWLHQSALGSFGYMENGAFREILSVPGYPRGLDFHDNVAVFGISKVRSGSGRTELPLSDKIAKSGQSPICGLLLVDVSTGAVVHKARFSDGIDEIYDVTFVRGTLFPKLVPPQSNESDTAYLLGVPKDHRLKV